MTDAWRSYRGAPEPGTAICILDDVPDPGTRSVSLEGFPVLLVRTGAMLRAFVNACPHQYLPLDQRGPHLLSADGTMIRCTNHQAGFRVEDGEGVEGHGVGCALDAIPVAIGEGRLIKIV